MALSFTNEIDGLHQNSSAPSVNIAAALIHSLFPGSIGFNLIQSYDAFLPEAPCASRAEFKRMRLSATDLTIK